MTQVTIPVNLGGDGLPFSDDGSSARDMLGQGYATHFFPMVNQTVSAVQTAVTAASAIATASTNTSSTSSVLIATGSKTFTVQTAKALIPGMWYIMASAANVLNSMTGQIVSYDSGTGALVINVQGTTGSGTYADWSGSVTGPLYIPAEAAVGEILTTPTYPGVKWLECDSSVYLQSSYPALYAKLGVLANYPVPSPATFGTSTSETWTGIAANNTRAVMVTSSGKISYSSNLTSAATWITITPVDATANYSSIVYGNGVFVAVASAGTNRCATSPDGITWTNRTIAASTWQRVIYAGGQFVAVGFAGVISTSPDGTTWTSRTSGVAWNLVDIAHNGTEYVAIAGVQQGIIHSSDGITWTTEATVFASNLSSNPRITSQGSNFIVSDASEGIGAVYKTSNITSWQQLSGTFGINTGNTSIVYADGVFVVLTTDSLFTSTDLSSWNHTPLSINGKWLYYSNGIVYMTGSTTTPKRLLLRSYDSSTQFCVPNSLSPVGLKTYIKALA